MSEDLTQIATFFVAGKEIGICVKSIEEVVNFPSVLSTVPRSPTYVQGVFNLRGSIIPVVSMAQILGLSLVSESQRPTLDSKVVVLNYEGEKIGLNVDSAYEILRTHVEEIAVLDSKSDSENLISAVVTLNDGKRIIEIFSVSEFFKLPGLPTLSMANGRSAVEIADLGRSRSQCITFAVGKARMAIDILGINEVVELRDLQSTVLVTENCIGFMNLRGENVPIIDFGKMLGLSQDEPSDSADCKVIITQAEGINIGLLISEVKSIQQYTAKNILPMPSSHSTHEKMFRGLLSQEGGEGIILLQHESIFTDTELASIGKGYANIFNKNFVKKPVSLLSVENSFWYSKFQSALPWQWTRFRKLSPFLQVLP